MKIGYRFAFEFSSSAILLAGGAALAQTPMTERVSVATGGAQGNADSGNMTGRAAITPGGRFVAFDSSASNLVVGDTNATADVFLRDRTNGTTERVSVGTGGVEANGSSSSASLSADGRFVAFDSYASNLVFDTNGTLDVFVHDRQLGVTERVNVDSAGAEANAFSATPSISADGRYVAFSSAASNLVVGDTNATFDVFVRDRQLAVTERVSVDSAGLEADYGGSWPSISADSRFVTFMSNATNLLPGGTSGIYDIYLHDRQLGVTERVSVDLAGNGGNSYSYPASISSDGRFVAFASGATNLVANAHVGVFVRDRLAGTTEIVSDAAGGVQGGGGSPSISGDGRFVAFQSDASNLVYGDTNGYPDVFVHDRTTGTTALVNVTPSGLQTYNYSATRSISPDGRFVVFNSYASNLVAGDTNSKWDVFVRDRGLLLPGTYCTSGITSLGCRAMIVASAAPSVSSSNACTIAVIGADGHKLGLLFYGVDNAGFSPVPWAPGSTSWKCVTGPTQRTLFQNSAGWRGYCNGSYTLDWNAYQAAHPLALGNPWRVGARVHAQACFRDPAAPTTSNLSNAVELIYIP